MSRRQPDARLTYAEYVVAAARSEIRHEFLDGCVYAMAGGTPEHAALALAFGGELRAALRGRPCRVFSSDPRVRVSATGLTTYPDLSVVCGKLETAADDPHALLNPVVLVEVLSESTEAYDRGAKAAHYRRIESLAEYVLVAQSEPLIEVHRRNERGHFELIEARAGEHAELASLGVRISVDAVYEPARERSASGLSRASRSAFTLETATSSNSPNETNDCLALRAAARPGQEVRGSLPIQRPASND